MNKNLNELVGLKQYVDGLIESVLYNEGGEEKQKELTQLPRAYTTDPLGIGPNKHNNPYSDEILRRTNNTAKIFPPAKTVVDKLVSNNSNYGKYGMTDLQKINDNDPELKPYKKMNMMDDKDPVSNNLMKKVGEKLSKDDPKGNNRITVDLQQKAIDWEQNRAFNKPINGPIPLKTTNLDKLTPAYVRDSANLLSQKAKADKELKQWKHNQQLNKEIAFSSRNNDYNSSLKGRIDNLGRGIHNKAQAVHDELSSIDHDAPKFAAGAAGLAGLGVAGYAAYKLAKRRKAEKAKNKK